MTDNSTARVMNHMDPETRAIHVALEQWGKICRDHIRAWPERTILGRMIKFGLTGAAQGGDRLPISLPQEVAAIDAAIAKLCEVDRIAVTVYYTREDEPIEVAARRCEMRVRQFQNVLRRARWRLAFAIK